jgi:hypothetical protein
MLKEIVPTGQHRSDRQYFITALELWARNEHFGQLGTIRLDAKHSRLLAKHLRI